MADITQTMSAANRVFRTPELLEAILLAMWKTRVGLTRCQAKDVLLSQRVSKAFQSCILGSLEIQRRLGFEPDIIQLPGPVEDEHGEWGQSHLLWANGDLIPALKGQPRVFFRKNARKISDESPYPLSPSRGRSPYTSSKPLSKTTQPRFSRCILSAQHLNTSSSKFGSVRCGR